MAFFKTIFATIALTFFASSALAQDVINAGNLAAIGPTTRFYVTDSLGRQLGLAGPSGGDASPVFSFQSRTNNSQWTFAPVGNSTGLFRLRNVAVPLFLSYPAAPSQGRVLEGQAVVYANHPASFVVQAIFPGQSGVNIIEANSKGAVTTWPTTINQGPVTFEVLQSGLAAQQNFTITAA